MRPIRVSDANAATVWSAVYAPFGATTSVTANPEVMNARFPGQWFQLETGLAYNWHRHYDATIGRYIQPDPLAVDDGDAAIKGIATDVAGSLASSRGSDGHATARSMGWQTAHDIIMSWPSSRAMMQDGPSVFGYAGQNALGETDKPGLFGLSLRPPGGDNLILKCAKKRPVFFCQSVICGAPHGGLYGPACPDCAAKINDGVPALLENGQILQAPVEIQE